MKVTIFEDDKDLADALKIYMDGRGFEVLNAYSLKNPEWKSAEVVLADYRNEIVSFEEVRKECIKDNIPLLAISGHETAFRPQLLKPFTLEDLRSAMLDAMKAAAVRRREGAGAEQGIIDKLKKIFG